MNKEEKDLNKPNRCNNPSPIENVFNLQLYHIKLT